MPYHLTEDETNKIIKHFGQHFYEKVLRDIETYTNRWGLKIIQLVDYYSVNCIFICQSEQYGDSVLKINNPCREVFTEYNTLCEYNGRHFCNVFDSDIDNGVILEEQIKPGIRLRDEKALDKRLFIFSNLFNGLHIKPADNTIYPTYFEWVNKITEYMKTRDDYKNLYLLMEKAKSTCSSLCKTYTKTRLLHGDFHHDNILLGNDNQYRIIDPKGVIGAPIFDIPRFIINEFYGIDNISFEDYSEHIRKITNYFERSLHIPVEIINKCIFIDTTMANCWNVESSQVPKMDYVMHAEAMMDSQRAFSDSLLKKYIHFFQYPV